jgi:Flp pilus assembly protein TadG
MVKQTIRSFLSEDQGISLLEGVIVFPIMLLTISALIEFSYGMYQWNQAAKTVQLAARKAAVSCPLTDDFDAVFAFDDAQGGQLISADSNTISQCGFGTGNECITARLDNLVDGPAENPENYSWKGMKRFFNQDDFTSDNVRVIYEQSGLGYQGRPDGPVVTLRLEIRNVTFDLPVVGALLGLPDVIIPSFPVTVGTEDLQSGPNDDCT